MLFVICVPGHPMLDILYILIIIIIIIYEEEEEYCRDTVWRYSLISSLFTDSTAYSSARDLQCTTLRKAAFLPGNEKQTHTTRFNTACCQTFHIMTELPKHTLRFNIIWWRHTTALIQITIHILVSGEIICYNWSGKKKKYSITESHG